MTKRALENIPLITGLVIIIGIIKLNLYYQNFDVPINNFISVSEIATTVAVDLLFFLLIYTALKTIQIFIKDVKPDFTLFSSKDSENLIFSLIFVFINIGLFVWGLFEKVYYRRIIHDAYTYFFLFITLMQTKFGKNFIEKNKEFTNVLYIFALTLVAVVNMTSREIKLVTSGKYNGTKVTTSDTTYVSNDTTYYIGQTDKSLFLYNTSNHCIVVPISTIKQLDIYINKIR